MMKGLIILQLTCTSIVVRGLTKVVDNTCLDKNSGEFYCCSNYEEFNGKCVECKPGFQSRNGNACIPCLSNLFGNGCSQVCNCNDLQKCDNAVGCVDKETTSTLEVPSHSYSAKYITSEESVRMAQKDEHNYGTGISKTELLMLYSGASSGIIVILGVLGILYCFKTRIWKSESKRVETNKTEVQNTAGNIKQDTLELHDRIYEEIDESREESKLHQQKPCPNFETDECTSNSESSTRCYLPKKIDETRLALPSMKKSNKSLFDNGTSSFHAATEDDSSSYDSTENCDYDRTSYLHPYNTLSSKTSNYHTYGFAKNVVLSEEDSS